MVIQTGDNKFGIVKWIVDPVAGQGTHTTIASAISSASAGDNIFIREGTYDEDITLKIGVALVAFGAGAADSGSIVNPENVVIKGKCSFSGAGITAIIGIQLETDGDFFLEVSGSNASSVLLENCFLNSTNNTGISFTSSDSGSLISIDSCDGDTSDTGIAHFSMSSPGILAYSSCGFSNTGGSTTASTASAGEVVLENTDWYGPIATSGTALPEFSFCFFSAANGQI